MINGFCRASLRFILVRVSKRPLVSPPIPERDIDPSSLPQSSSSNASSPTLAPSSLPPSPLSTPDHLKNNSVPLPPHPLLSSPALPSRSDSSVEDYLLPKALTTSSVRPALSLIHQLSSPKDWLSEIIYILRPLIYASLLSADRRTNRPLVCALVLELFSRNLRRNPSHSAALERSEYARRDRDMFWYLFRGSIWESYTRPKLEAIAYKTANIPLDMDIVPGAKASAIWVTTDGSPTNDTNRNDDGAARIIAPADNFGLVPPQGTNLRSTDLAPGAITPMHRTSSVDYNILVEGQLILITEDGMETLLRNPGDVVIQKGTMHAWRNPGPSWARWVSVLLSAEPAVVNGNTLMPEFAHEDDSGPSGPR
ncbi:hypothetical protein ONZ45_g7206 [Pleurotus djamor]|nr:hypothetical protein ONZ45_g7206 [Pleurotus djamor]